MPMNVPSLKDDAEIYAQQLAFDFFNHNYIDWDLAEQLSKKKNLDPAEQGQAVQMLAALCRQRAKVGKSMS